MNVHINKKLPVAGGMGGGSSNAGRLLRLLSDTYPNKVSEKNLSKIALQIGADVPFFLNPLPSLARGLGEKLEILPGEKIPLLLITLNFPVSAAWAYKNRNRPFNSSGLNAAEIKKMWLEKKFSQLVFNDLGFPVIQKFPLVGLALKDLKSNGAKEAAVSGSGPTVFGIFESEQQVMHCRKKLLQAGYPKANLITAAAG